MRFNVYDRENSKWRRNAIFRRNDSNRTLHSSQLHRSVQSTTFLSPLLRSDLLPAVGDDGGDERPLSMPRADRMGMDGVQIVCEGCGARLPHQSRGTKAFFCLCAFQMSCV